MPIPRTALLFNPRAGQASSNRLAVPGFSTQPGDPVEAVRAHLRIQLGQDVPEYPCETLDQITSATKKAVADGVEILIAAGGDGTLRAVADVLAGTKTVMAVLPVGTVNVLARELGIPLDSPERAIDIALMGRTAMLDMGRITAMGLLEEKAIQQTKTFLLMCSVGFDAHAVANVNPELKGLMGTSAYVVSGLTTLATYAPVRFTITADDFLPETLDAFSIVVANAASYAGDFQLATEAEMDDGMLDVAIFAAPPGLPPVQSAVFLRQAAAAALGRLESDPDARIFRAYRLRIEAETPTAVQLDGDPCGLTPLDIEILPRALAIRMPAILGEPSDRG